MHINGSCLCGAVSYEVTAALGTADHCHCSMCRKAHGAAFGTYAECDPDSFQWTSGADKVTFHISSGNGGRCFCSDCGSTLGGFEDGRITAVTLGTVDGDPGVRPQAHIFVGSRAEWFDITDDLPQHEEWPPGHE